MKYGEASKLRDTFGKSTIKVNGVSWAEMLGECIDRIEQLEKSLKHLRTSRDFHYPKDVDNFIDKALAGETV